MKSVFDFIANFYKNDIAFKKFLANNVNGYRPTDFPPLVKTTKDERGEFKENARREKLMKNKESEE